MTQKYLDFAVIGNVGIDTNIYMSGHEIDFSVEANFTENLDYVGQAGGYTSRGFAQLGYKTAFIGYIGDDYSGQFILKEFQRDNINTYGLFIDPAGTSRSINFMYPDGRRKNFYDGKSHMTLDPDMIACQSILEKTRFVHFHIPNWARKLLHPAKDLGLTVSCDLQDTVDIHDNYRSDFIQHADILFFSAANHDSPEPLMRSIMDRYPGKIIVSGMGANGCSLAHQNRIEYFAPVELDSPVIDTNGAGDGLAVGFLSSYLIDAYSLQDSILRGQICARFTCSKKADTSALITKQQLDSYFEKLK